MIIWSGIGYVQWSSVDVYTFSNKNLKFNTKPSGCNLLNSIISYVVYKSTNQPTIHTAALKYYVKYGTDILKYIKIQPFNTEMWLLLEIGVVVIILKLQSEWHT